MQFSVDPVDGDNLLRVAGRASNQSYVELKTPNAPKQAKIADSINRLLGAPPQNKIIDHV